MDREHLPEASCQVAGSQVPCAELSRERAGWVPHSPAVPSHLPGAHDRRWEPDEWAGEGLSTRDCHVWWKVIGGKGFQVGEPGETL